MSLIDAFWHVHSAQRNESGASDAAQIEPASDCTKTGGPPPLQFTEPPSSAITGTQLPIEQPRPAAHAEVALQAPQNVLSDWRSTQRPMHGVVPVGQLPVPTHWLEVQTSLAPHMCPHEPQLAGSLTVMMQLPPHSTELTPHEGPL